MSGTGDVICFRDGRFSCEKCGVRGECLVCGLNAGGETNRQRVVHSGDHLFRMTDPFQSLYVIRSGSIKCYVVSEDGEEQILGFYGAGDVIGFDAIANGYHASSAAALETSSTCKLSFDVLTRLCHRSPLVLDQLVKSMSRDALQLVDRLLLSRRSAEERVAAFLRNLSAQQGRRGYSATLLTLPMSRTDVGKYLGLTVETVSRVLSRFQELGLLTKDRNRVQLQDLEALRRVAASPAIDGAGADATLDQRLKMQTGASDGNF